MQLGLKNRLRLISLLPIFLLFSLTSYYVYTSFIQYQSAQLLKNRLTKKKYLDDLIENIARERGISAMYLGHQSQNTSISLHEQRRMVDKKISIFIKYINNNLPLHNHSRDINNYTCLVCIENKIIKNQKSEIKKVRQLIDSYKIEFNEIFKIYSSLQSIFISQLEQNTNIQVDKYINELYALYISMSYTKEFAGIERGYISYIVSRSTKLTEADLNKWVSIIGKSDYINYDTLHDKELKKRLDILFKDNENIELFKDINSVRTGIVSASRSGDYPINSEIWFAMQSEKINIISDAQNLLLDAINKRVEIVKANSLKILIITFGIWVVAIIFGALGYLLSNEIAKNIKHLEDILRRAAHGSDVENEHINLHTSIGTNMAYELLESIINQTKLDKKYAQEQSESKSMFLANMSHEIRTPLNGIVGFAGLLKGSGLKNEQKEFIQIIEKSSQNLLDIIKNILDISKIENNKHEIESTVFNPIEEFQSAVDVYAVKANEKNIDLACFIDPQLQSPLIGDPTKIKEVLLNLISNSIKFTGSNGCINVSIKKVASSSATKTKINFLVSDNGIGISNEQSNKIFEAFSQADISISRKYGGTGLGLTISSSFVELMGGKLDLVSTGGNYTKFFFDLEFEEIGADKDIYKNKFSNLTAAILIDPQSTKTQDLYIKEYLEYYGVNYIVFNNFQEIKELLKTKTYNLILINTDYTDLDLLKEYSSLSSELVIITKISMIQNINNLNLNIFQTLYSPVHTFKIEEILLNYISNNNKTELIEHTQEEEEEHSIFKADILVAEDNIINQKLIKKVFETYGLNIYIVNNGLEAFQKIKQQKFDLIFMDIQMPILDGIEATKEILIYENEMNIKHTPIVALTANALRGDKEKFLKGGLDEYITKPLVRDEITYVLKKYLLNQHHL